MEEKVMQQSVSAEQLNEVQKDVLDEFILDLKNNKAIITLHEENNRTFYIRKCGRGAFMDLIRSNLDYITINGDLSKDESARLVDFLADPKPE